MTERPPHQYVLARVYAAVILVLWNVAGLRALAGDDPPGWEMGILVPFVLPALFMVFNLMTLRWPFSVFGRFEPSPSPSESYISEVTATSGKVGLLAATSPFFTWSLYGTGIAFRVFGVARGFVPLATIKRTEKRIMWGCTVWHSSPEVRSPLVIPSNELFRELELLLARNTPARTGG